MGQITVWIEAYRNGELTRVALIEHLQGFDFQTPERFATMPDDVFEAEAQAEERTYCYEGTADELYMARDNGLLGLDDLVAIMESLRFDHRVRPARSERMSRSRRCPTCGAAGVRIVYGMPGPELFEAADRGEVFLGGCVIGDDDPTYACGSGHRWGRREGL